MAKEIQKESVKVIFKNVVERIKDVRILRQQMQEPSDPEYRVLKGHVYCHKCSKGPFPVNKTFNCDNCSTRLKTGLSVSAQNLIAKNETWRWLKFFQQMEARRIRREEQLAQARQRIAAKREQVYRHLESVLKSVAPLIAVGVPHSLPSASALSPPRHLEAQYYREGNTVMTYRKEDGKIAFESSQDPQLHNAVRSIVKRQLPLFPLPAPQPENVNLAVGSTCSPPRCNRQLDPLSVSAPLIPLTRLSPFNAAPALLHPGPSRKHLEPLSASHSNFVPRRDETFGLPTARAWGPMSIVQIDLKTSKRKACLK